MRRRDFLRTGALLGVTTAVAGCNTGGNSDGNTPNNTSTPTSGPDGQTPQDTETATDEEDDQQTEEDTETAVRYFFDDETGALGHLADDEVPENYDHVVTNTTSESEYEEMQTNDSNYAAGILDGELDMTASEMINRAEEIYNNPEQEFNVPDSYDDINFTEEDDEVIFLRALIKASQEAGVNSSGMADIIVNSIAEDAVDQIQPGFADFKLTTLNATEPINPNSTGAYGGAERENEWGQTYVNSGLVHSIGLLQYEKNGEEKVKYSEIVDSLSINIFRRVIRDPEDSLYRTSLDNENVDNSRDYETGDTGTMFPEHYVTALDYEKARELESQDILGLGESSDGGINGIGDYLVAAMTSTIDDRIMRAEDGGNNPDRRNGSMPRDGQLVSAEFGESVEDYVTDPTVDKRGNFRNVSRGIYQLFQQEGWDTSIAITGTLEDPEILPTDQSTVDQVRQDGAYDEVRERVTA